jgi:hypothetical protein
MLEEVTLCEAPANTCGGHCTVAPALDGLFHTNNFSTPTTFQAERPSIVVMSLRLSVGAKQRSIWLRTSALIRL